MRGKVKFFNEDKGYGFIRPDENHNDVFVHIKDAQKAKIGLLRQGDAIEFDVAEGRDGRLSATNLCRI